MALLDKKVFTREIKLFIADVEPSILGLGEDPYF